MKYSFRHIKCIGTPTVIAEESQESVILRYEPEIVPSALPKYFRTEYKRLLRQKWLRSKKVFFDLHIFCQMHATCLAHCHVSELRNKVGFANLKLESKGQKCKKYLLALRSSTVPGKTSKKGRPLVLILLTTPTCLLPFACPLPTLLALKGYILIIINQETLESLAKRPVVLPTIMQYSHKFGLIGLESIHLDLPMDVFFLFFMVTVPPFPNMVCTAPLTLCPSIDLKG